MSQAWNFLCLSSSIARQVSLVLPTRSLVCFLSRLLRTPQLKLSYAVPKRSEAELSKSRKLYVSKLGDVTKGASFVILLSHSRDFCLFSVVALFDYLFVLFLY
jgi:hypothetical protein